MKLSLYLAAALALAAASGDAQLTPRTGMTPGEPCCGVIAVNKATGIVTLKVLATGATTSMCVSQSSDLSRFNVGDKVSFAPSAPPNKIRSLEPLNEGRGIAPKAAKPSAPPNEVRNAATAGAGGTTSCGSNVGRNEDTRPKECVAKTSTGQEIKIACPQNVPIRTTPR